jgi:hypothetical protein
MADYRIAGRQLYNLYRAVARFREEISPAAAGAPASRCVQDLIEERRCSELRSVTPGAHQLQQHYEEVDEVEIEPERPMIAFLPATTCPSPA